jgi:cell division septation protein DedD
MDGVGLGGSKMKRVHLISLVMCMAIAASAVAGNLWIFCEPGLDVFLDGEFVGVSEQAEGGKRLPGISAGEHTIRIEKDGFTSAEYSIDVGVAANQVVVGELSAEVTEEPAEASREAVENQAVGTIEITSDPRECNVKFASRRILKTQPIMTIPGLPVGEHKLWFESSATVLNATVAVEAARTVRVVVDFRNKRVAITGADSGRDGTEPTAEEEKPETETGCVEYWVQVLRTSDPEAIEPTRSALKDQGFPLYHQKLITVEDEGALPLYKIRVGPITRRNQANHVAGLMRHAGFKTAWVVPEKCQ